MLQPSVSNVNGLFGNLKRPLRSRTILLVIGLLLWIDGLLILARLYRFVNNRFHFSTFVLSSDFTLIRERGYSEWWEYGKMALAASLYALGFVRSRQLVYLAVTLICWWIPADNFLQLHEHADDMAPLFAFAPPLFPSVQLHPIFQTVSPPD